MTLLVVVTILRRKRYDREIHLVNHHCQSEALDATGTGTIKLGGGGGTTSDLQQLQNLFESKKNSDFLVEKETIEICLRS
jgi:hypothetical protein